MVVVVRACDSGEGAEEVDGRREKVEEAMDGRKEKVKVDE